MPQLRLYRSNRLERLAEPLLELLRTPADSDPLAQERILVGSRGMEEWLRFRIAERFGIAAHVEFAFPGSLLTCFGAGPATLDLLRPDIACWKVAELLGDSDAPMLRRFADAGGQTPAVVDRRRYTLARQIADLFDRYGFHCPEIVESWARPVSNDDERWQADLWTRLRATIPDAVATPGESVRSGEPDLSQVGSRVVIFGLSSLPALLLRVLARLAPRVDIHLFLLVPSPHLLDVRNPLDDPERNALASAFGRSASALQVGLIELQESLGPSFDEPLDLDLFDDPADGGRPSLLSRLQSDLFHLRSTGGIVEKPELDDGAAYGGLTVHACGSPMRQVEALRDALYRAFDADRTLLPRDVVVMTPAIGDWYPLVSAAFGASGAREALPAIPWRVLDLSMRQTNPVAMAVIRVLQLASARCTAGEVIDLLSLDVVRTRHGLSNDDVEILVEQLERQGLRWGIDAEHRAMHGVETDERHTWRDALDRLALSIVSPSSASAWCGIAADNDRAEQTDAVLALLRFTTTLFADLAQARAPRPLVDWIDWIVGRSDSGGLIARYVELPDKSRYLLRAVVADLEQAREIFGQQASTTTVAVDALVAWLENRYDAAEKLEGSGLGAVTFGSFVPSRSIPYRLVCLLGMDEATFPRRTVPPRWDLSRRPGKAGRPSVPSPADDDRSLFLEAILAARSDLQIFYTAADARTGLSLPPCGPVAELLEMVRVQRGGTLDSVVVSHPMMSFSPRNFDPHAVLRSFDGERLDAARALVERRVERVEFAGDDLSMPLDAVMVLDCARLAWILRDPSRALVTRIVESDLSNFDDVPDALLPVDLDPGSREAVVEALKIHRRGVDADQMVDELSARATYPLTRDRRQVAREVAAEAAPLLALLASHRDGRTRRSVVVSLRRDAVELRDFVDDVYDDVLVPDVLERDPETAPLDLFVRLCAACVATGGSVWRATRVGRTKIGQDVAIDSAIEGASPAARAQYAAERLGDLLSIAASCLRGRVRLAGRTSAAFANALAKQGLCLGDEIDVESMLQAIGEARDRWEASENEHRSAESTYENTALIWGDRAPYDPEQPDQPTPHPDFVDLACRVWLPVFDAERQAAPATEAK